MMFVAPSILLLLLLFIPSLYSNNNCGYIERIRALIHSEKLKDKYGEFSIIDEFYQMYKLKVYDTNPNEKKLKAYITHLGPYYKMVESIIKRNPITAWTQDPNGTYYYGLLKSAEYTSTYPIVRFNKIDLNYGKEDAEYIHDSFNTIFSVILIRKNSLNPYDVYTYHIRGDYENYIKDTVFVSNKKLNSMKDLWHKNICNLKEFFEKDLHYFIPHYIIPLENTEDVIAIYSDARYLVTDLESVLSLNVSFLLDTIKLRPIQIDKQNTTADVSFIRALIFNKDDLYILDSNFIFYLLIIEKTDNIIKRLYAVPTKYRADDLAESIYHKNPVTVTTDSDDFYFAVMPNTLNYTTAMTKLIKVKLFFGNSEIIFDHHPNMISAVTVHKAKFEQYSYYYEERIIDKLPTWYVYLHQNGANRFDNDIQIIEWKQYSLKTHLMPYYILPIYSETSSETDYGFVIYPNGSYSINSINNSLKLSDQTTCSAMKIKKVECILSEKVNNGANIVIHDFLAIRWATLVANLLLFACMFLLH